MHLMFFLIYCSQIIDRFGSIVEHSNAHVWLNRRAFVSSVIVLPSHKIRERKLSNVVNLVKHAFDSYLIFRENFHLKA